MAIAPTSARTERATTAAACNRILHKQIARSARTNPRTESGETNPRRPRGEKCTNEFPDRHKRTQPRSPLAELQNEPKPPAHAAQVVNLAQTNCPIGMNEPTDRKRRNEPEVLARRRMHERIPTPARTNPAPLAPGRIAKRTQAGHAAQIRKTNPSPPPARPRCARAPGPAAAPAPPSRRLPQGPYHPVNAADLCHDLINCAMASSML